MRAATNQRTALRVLAHTAFVLCVLGASLSAAAASFTVTTVNDTFDGACDADCSLRDAIGAANADASATPAAPHLIDLTGVAGTITLTLTPGSGIAIGNHLHVEGPGAALLAISGNSASQIFDNNCTGGNTLIVEKLTLRDGSAFLGGAIHNNCAGSDLTVRDCVFENNEATGNNGGAIESDDGARLTVIDSTFNNNRALASTGGAVNNFDGTLIVENSTFTNNQATFSGALASWGTRTNCDTENVYALVAYDPGPGSNHIVSGTITTDGTVGSGLDPLAIITDYTATLSDGSTTTVIDFASNGLIGFGATITASATELALDAGTNSFWCLSSTCAPPNAIAYEDILFAPTEMNVLLYINGSTDDQGLVGSRIIATSPSAATVTGSVFDGNTSIDNVGGAYFECKASVSDSTFSNNQAGFGGFGFIGGLSMFDGTFELSSSVISGNSADHVAGMNLQSGSFVLSDVEVSNNATSGFIGGINSANATLIMQASTISGNLAAAPGSTGGGGEWGPGSYTLINSVVEGNEADCEGGGINTFDVTTLNVINSTFAFNDSVSCGFGGGIHVNAASTLDLSNSIFWQNNGSDILDTGTPGTVNNNLVESNAGNAIVDGLDGNKVGADPLFTSSASPVDLRLLLGSPAIDMGDNGSVPTGVTTDLDGAVRIEGGTVDMGAYETGPVYELVAYDPGPGSNHIVSGTIMTDGTMGSGLDPLAIITDYTATLSDGSTTTIIDFATNGLIGFGATITASATELTLDAGTNSVWCLSSTCGPPNAIVYEDFLFAPTEMNVLLYINGSTDDQGLVGSRIIAVPEASGPEMLIAGLVLLMALQHRRRSHAPG
jgi:CSLREA domain-containing protein